MRRTFIIFFNSILFILLISNSLFAQEVTSIKGFVIDEDGAPVTGVKISLGKGYAITDKDGNFIAEVGEGNESFDNIQFFKRGHALKTWEKTQKNGDEVLKIYTSYTEFELLGKAFDEYGEVLKNTEVVLATADPQIIAQTNDKGIFSMHIPAYVRVNKSSVFIMKGRKVESDGIEYQEKGGILHVSLPVKMQKIVVFDESNQRLDNFDFKVNGKNYTTSNKGEVNIRLGDKQDNTFTASGFEQNEVKYLAADQIIMVYLKKSEFDNTEAKADTDLNTTDNNNDKEELIATAKTEDLVEEYGKDFNYIINELELEKQMLIERSNQIRTEMEKVAEKMSQEEALTDDEQQMLNEYMTQLESQLIENDLAYEDAQVKTKEIIDRMKMAMINKDSLNQATEEKLEEAVIEKQKVEKELQRDLLIFSVVACSLLAILGVTVFSSRRIKKQRNELAIVNQQLNEAKDELVQNVKEINSQNEEIKKQSEDLKILNIEVTQKNKKITDNIRYALTVQEALLPSQEKMKKYLKDFFITYLPKDIVSGDFYWFTNIPAEDGESEKLFVAAVDCTGHGVSGAFMSLIGSTLLNEIVNQRKIYKTDEILYELNRNVAHQLKQKENAGNDGMDLSLCCIEYKNDDTVTVNYSGAKRPFTYFDHQTKEIKSIRGDRKSVGGKHNLDYQFSNQEIQLQKGDCIYLDSDGLTDQNNSQRERFGTQRLQNLLLEIAENPMTTQKKILEENLASHQAENEQRDDILVMGIRL